MLFTKWFDPDNYEHIKAYKHLQEYGIWPESFWEKAKENCEVWQDSWNIIIAFKLANRWIEYKLEYKE